MVFPAGIVISPAPAMQRLYRQMAAVVAADLPVLIAGETGVGKEVVVRLLHASSRRRQGPLVAVNCAAIPAELLEAELFGIGEGVATGVRGRPGRFRAVLEALERAGSQRGAARLLGIARTTLARKIRALGIDV